MGVVIGETTVIGDNVTLYQGVTLGGTGKENGKRHPTLEHNIIVGAGAKILGNITIGSYTKIGANSVDLKNVPEHSTVVGIPGRIVRIKGEIIENNMPDPVANRINSIIKRLECIERNMEPNCKSAHTDNCILENEDNEITDL